MLGASKLAAFVSTTDMTQALTFYRDVLGLELLDDMGFAVMFDANGTTLRVTAVDQLTPHPFTVLGWEVEDIVAVVRGLAGRGVVFETFEGTGIEQDADCIWHAGGGDQVAWFKDPDGNLLSVSSHLGPA